eukprot:m.36072 g.36072  ORF g.36072 m.36072 type:complete len:152 (-) comp11373_c0_seq1:351-806(-)
MRHGNAFRRLGRDSAHRLALLRNLTTALFKYERIETTLAKAKELRRPAEKLITHGKAGTNASKTIASKYLMEAPIVDKLFTTLAERYATRPGGYTRILKAGFRKGDSATMAIVELVDNGLPALRPPKEERVKPRDKPAPAAAAKDDRDEVD